MNKMKFPSYFECQKAMNKLKSITPKEYKKKFSKEELDKTLHEQQELLQDCIISNGTQNFFNIFNMGCSTGKTYVAVNSMPYYLNNVSCGFIEKKGVLFVIRQTDECDKYADYLNSLFEDKDIGHKSNVAISYHSKKYTTEDGYVDEEKRNKLLGQIKYYPILFICHENYINLTENEDLRNNFTQNRRLLIIDESIDICETIQVRNKKLEEDENIISLEKIEELKDKLQDGDKKLFEHIISPLFVKFDELNKEESIINRTYNFKIKHKQYNENIREFIKNIIPEYEKSIKTDLENILRTVSCIYNDTCLLNKKLEDGEKQDTISIKTINRNKRMWTLKNNIILDASALLEPKYELDKNLYFLMNNQPTLDYSKWRIEFILGSSTKFSKGIGRKYLTQEQRSRYIRFLGGCSQIITDLGIDNTLVVCHKEEHIQITKLIKKEIPYNTFQDFGINIPLENIEHFGNITGKREFERLQNVLIMHTPNYEDSDYILQYMYYKNIRYPDNVTFKNSSIKGLNYIHIFDNQDIEEFKEKTIANHIYQAVCRVNREMEHNTTIVIISQYLGSILYVRDMLDCKCVHNSDYDIYFEVVKNKINEDRKQNSKDNKLKTFFAEILNGNISNYDIDYIQINPNIIKVKKEDIKTLLKFNDTQFNKAKSNNDIFITNNTIICNRDYYYFILDTT